MWLGTYERAYPRARVLVEGLRAAGVDVVEHHRPVWERRRHKAGLGPLALAGSAARWAGAWAALAPGALRERPVDAVVAGYPAQPDAAPAWLVARARRVPLVVDMMISLADTLAGDRAVAGRAAGALLAGVDRAGLRMADLVLADTAAGADWLSERFGVPRGRVAVVPVGAEPQRFPPAPAPPGPPTALFYGKLAPLHGVATVLAAAREPGVPPVRLIGDGQLGPWLEAELARDRPPGLTWERWVPYERLGAEVAGAAICLGVFGTSAKAARVVPNKVWQAMAVGRPVVTGDTPGVREVLTDGAEGLLVPPGDAPALAAALRCLAADRALRERMGLDARAAYLRGGTPAAAGAALRDALAPLVFGR
ncbi:glycosyltransferase [Miltoncostaea marina]|uniref:glycosyltransferase n=1 Tax=Miltoncostaea marina TaxID=2843215 RepID=UPI001C3E0C71|nr:glycosyltransferase [Miltoncostaea marina]